MGYWSDILSLCGGIRAFYVLYLSCNLLWTLAKRLFYTTPTKVVSAIWVLQLFLHIIRKADDPWRQAQQPFPELWVTGYAGDGDDAEPLRPEAFLDEAAQVLAPILKVGEGDGDGADGRLLLLHHARPKGLLSLS